MLNFIRDNVQSFFIKVIVIIVAAVMLLFGVNFFDQQGINVVATVGDSDIKLEDYNRAYQAMESSYIQIYKGQARQMMEQHNLKAVVLEQLVKGELLVQSARANGMQVTDLEVVEKIQEEGPFQTEGRFDKSKYEELLKANRVSARTYEEDLRKQLLREKVGNMINDGQSVSKAYVKKIYERDETRFVADVIQLERSRFQVDAQPTEEEQKAFYQEHLGQFKQPKEFSVNYFVIDSADEAEEVNVRDKEIEKYYQRNRSEFQQKPGFRSRHILIQIPQDGNQTGMDRAQAQAEKIAGELKANPSDFAALAKRYSKDPGSAKKGGEIGWTEPGQLVSAYQGALESLKVGEISSPVLSEFGYHVIQLLDTKEAGERPFEEVKDEIRTKIAQKKAKRRLENRAAKLAEDLKTKAFAQIATEEKKEVKASPSFSAGTLLEDIGLAFMLYQKLEAKKLNDKGSMSLDGGKKILVYELAAIKEQRTKEFAEVKEEVYPQVKAEQEAKKTLEAMLNAANGVKDENAFQRFAKTNRAESKRVSFLYKSPRVPGLSTSREFQMNVFGMVPAQVATVLDQNRVYLVNLVEKTPGVLGEGQGALQLEERLKKEKGAILIENLIKTQEKTVEVKYNRQILTALEIPL